MCASENPSPPSLPSGPISCLLSTPSMPCLEMSTWAWGGLWAPLGLACGFTSFMLLPVPSTVLGMNSFLHPSTHLPSTHPPIHPPSNHPPTHLPIHPSHSPSIYLYPIHPCAPHHPPTHPPTIHPSSRQLLVVPPGLVSSSKPGPLPAPVGWQIHTCKQRSQNSLWEAQWKCMGQGCHGAGSHALRLGSPMAPGGSDPRAPGRTGTQDLFLAESPAQPGSPRANFGPGVFSSPFNHIPAPFPCEFPI